VHIVLPGHCELGVHRLEGAKASAIPDHQIFDFGSFETDLAKAGRMVFEECGRSPDTLHMSGDASRTLYRPGQESLAAPHRPRACDEGDAVGIG
jgi:hypothetical protein